MDTFTWRDYLRMYKSRGIKMVATYFYDAHLFDLINGTDTHTRVGKEDYALSINNLEHGSLYMASWTSEIKLAFAFLFNTLGDQIAEFTFIDFGCGKGKVPIVWELECKKRGVKSNIIGIDYYPPFIEIAKTNSIKVLGHEGEFLLSDAAQWTPENNTKKIILYLYNPFDKLILRKILQKISNIETYIIYNNPVNSSLITDLGWEKISESSGFHPNNNTIIFYKSK